MNNVPALQPAETGSCHFINSELENCTKQSGSKTCRLFTLGALQQMVYRQRISEIEQLKHVLKLLTDCWTWLRQGALN